MPGRPVFNPTKCPVPAVTEVGRPASPGSVTANRGGLVSDLASRPIVLGASRWVASALPGLLALADGGGQHLCFAGLPVAYDLLLGVPQQEQ
jgi:hypothetical protein